MANFALGTLQLLLVFLLAQVTQQNVCRKPDVDTRPLATDVRAASPFYVVALPRTPRTEMIDNVCYSYYEIGDNKFTNIISVTFKDGRNEYFPYTKGDIPGNPGVAEARAQSGRGCIFHDYTLTPICNSTVFVLYRCYVLGCCLGIDIRPIPGADVRVVLSATPRVDVACYQEIEQTLQNTTFFRGGDYIIFPQRLKPRCVTSYKNRLSIGHDRAFGCEVVL